MNQIKYLCDNQFIYIAVSYEIKCQVLTCTFFSLIGTYAQQIKAEIAERKRIGKAAAQYLNNPTE